MAPRLATWIDSLIGTVARLTLIAALVLAALVALDPWLSTATSLQLLLLNLLPAGIVFALALAFVRRYLASLVLTIAFLAVVFYVNQIKIEHLETPLLLSDLGLVRQFFTEIGLFVRYSHGAILVLAVAVLVAIVAILVRIERQGIPWTAALFSACLGISTLFMLRGNTLGDLYRSHGVMDTPWQIYHEVTENGLLASLAANAHDVVLARPKRDESGYKSLVRSLLPEAEGADHNPVRPDIVMVLAESFFEPGVLREVDTCAILLLWCELKQIGIHGQMTVPTIGGNTTRTEFEVLVGVPYASLPRPVYPYNAIVNRPTLSIIWWLRELGYTATGLHTYSASFWRRNEAYPHLGFQDFITEEVIPDPERSGPFISDGVLKREILKRLNDEPGQQFIFAISMEGHGPWGKTRKGLNAEQVAAIATPAFQSTEAIVELQQFGFHARNSVRALKELHEAVLQRDKPTLIVFFGDHLPALPKLFREAGFRDDKSPSQQQVPYLALANFPIDPDWKPESSDQLGLWALELAGLPLPEHYRLMVETYKTEVDRDHQMKIARPVFAELLHLAPGSWKPPGQSASASLIAQD